MKKILALIFGLFILGAATSAGCWWVKPDEVPFDPYVIIKNHESEAIKRFPNFKVTRIWVDESGYAIMIDSQQDGKEDSVHIHTIVFFLEDGTPVVQCEGTHLASEFLKFVEEKMRRNSI